MKLFRLVALLLLVCFSVWANQNDQQAKLGSYQTELLSGKVKIIVSFKQEEYQVGDSIPLFLTIQNDSEDTLGYDWKGYGYDGADITILLCTPDQKKAKKTAIAPIFDFRRKAFISHSYDDIPPHQKSTRTIELTNFFVITKPGDYIVSLTSFLLYYDYIKVKPPRQPLKFTIDEMKLKIIEKKVENTEKNNSPHPVKGDIRNSASDRKDVSPLNSN